MELPADPGLPAIYTGQPGSPTEEKFSLLASWTATETRTARHHGRQDLTLATHPGVAATHVHHATSVDHVFAKPAHHA